MSTKGIFTAIIAAFIVVIASVYFFEVEITQEAKLPEVEVEGGQLPKADVETGSVEIGEKETNVTVPEITMEEKTVTVPTVDIEPAQESASNGSDQDTSNTVQN